MLAYTPPVPWLRSAGWAAALAALAAFWAQGSSPVASASVARGTEEAFATGLHRREIPPGHGPQRWTTDRAKVVFRNLRPGPASLEVRLHGQRDPVVVAVDGVIVGHLDAGHHVATFEVPATPRSTRVVELRTETFVAGDGRRLGALLDSVALRDAPRTLPGPGVLLAFLLPALCAVAVAWAARAPWSAGVLGAALTVSLEAGLLVPSGVLRSGYAVALPVLLCVGFLGTGLVAGWIGRRVPGAGPWALVALAAAFMMHGVLATSPIMVVSDAVFHANNLSRVAAGDLFLTSVTQHGTPFRFPYGVSFYALLAPLARAGLDGVALVRWGAALAGLAASWGLFLSLVSRGPRLAGVAVLILQLLPGAFDVYSFGNLSNAFGQALTVLFFGWWTGRAPGGWIVGAGLFVLGCLGHFSSFVVLATVGCALLVGRGRAMAEDRPRLLALALGLAASILYYASFWQLVWAQIPRLLEGGGQGRAASGAVWEGLWLQGLGCLRQWGLPAMTLAALGLPRPRRSSLDRDVTSFWAGGAVLFLAAALSPLDVRYLYALTPVVAIACGAGWVRAWDRGRWSRGGAALLLAGQAVLAVRNLAEAVLVRYRS